MCVLSPHRCAVSSRPASNNARSNTEPTRGRQQWQPASSTAPAGLHHQRPPHPAATRFCGSSQSTPNKRLLAHRTPWGRQQWQPASSTAPAGLHHQRPPHPVATRFCGSSQSTPNAYSLIARLGVDSSGSQHHLRLLQVYITNDHHTPLPPDFVAAPNRRPTPTRSSHALGSTTVAADITYGSRTRHIGRGEGEPIQYMALSLSLLIGSITILATALFQGRAMALSMLCKPFLPIVRQLSY